jgi:regulator of protease activity HflC (stomatin/prohibitin superfamily)
MASFPTDTPSVGDPFARLEAGLIDDYQRSRGYDPAALRARGDTEARRLLADASTYAAARLTEVESRAHYVHDIHSGRSS